MKSTAYRTIIGLLLCGAALAVPGVAAGQESASGADYIIGPGDVLTISVWKDEALTRQAIVLPDGKIAFPLIDQVQASGRSVAEVSREIEQKLAKYVPDATLSVVVHQVNSMLVYVIGRVNSPGRFAVNTDLSVLQALAMAGGLNPFAKRRDIKVFRESDGETRIFPFDYDAVSGGANLKHNIRLKRGDVIVVP